MTMYKIIVLISLHQSVAWVNTIVPFYTLMQPRVVLRGALYRFVMRITTSWKDLAVIQKLDMSSHTHVC